MIRGFDTETAPLSDYERSAVLPVLLALLRARIGPESAITSNEIADTLGARYDISGPRIRKVINHIRNNDLIPCLLASSKGYWVASSKAEVEDYIESLSGRISSQIADLEAIKRQMRIVWDQGPVQGTLF